MRSGGKKIDRNSLMQRRGGPARDDDAPRRHDGALEHAEQEQSRRQALRPKLRFQIKIQVFESYCREQEDC